MRDGPRIIEGDLAAQGCRFAIVASRFNAFIVDRLVEGAVDALVRHGAAADSITIARVPGSLEIAFAARRLARAGGYDAIICLGAVIRGGTPHFEHVAAEAIKAVQAVCLETDVPIVMGILTTDTLEQAIERAGTKAGNKGEDAALAAIEMVRLIPKLRPPA
ncbi:MAG: 6,7-dimethyl-8-ribityllumazine synthase [Deltaproteobacteria bacterium]|nr:6,7-dimethyl-8-ribityllumazine synthase [Deltaproteobacteria bacterium]